MNGAIFCGAFVGTRKCGAVGTHIPHKSQKDKKNQRRKNGTTTGVVSRSVYRVVLNGAGCYENYVSWSSRLLRYAKSRPNGKLIHNSIINGPYVRRMTPEPGDSNRKVSVNETFHVQIDDELTEKELKQIEADDQAIQTILLGL
nr:hypothetical protein [Tanacetum cinerariifolium]